MFSSLQVACMIAFHMDGRTAHQRPTAMSRPAYVSSARRTCTLLINCPGHCIQVATLPCPTPTPLPQQTPWTQNYSCEARIDSATQPVQTQQSYTTSPYYSACELIEIPESVPNPFKIKGDKSKRNKQYKSAENGRFCGHIHTAPRGKM